MQTPRADAYLVIWVAVKQTPPTIAGAGIYSEAHPSSMNLNEFQPWPIFWTTSPTGSYAEASDQIKALVRNDVSLAWIRPLLRESDR